MELVMEFLNHLFKICRIYLKTFFVIGTCLDDCTYQVSSPYKVFNLVAVANMSERNTSKFMGGVQPPFGVPRKPPFT